MHAIVRLLRLLKGYVTGWRTLLCTLANWLLSQMNPWDTFTRIRCCFGVGTSPLLLGKLGVGISIGEVWTPTGTKDLGNSIHYAQPEGPGPQVPAHEIHLASLCVFRRPIFN